MIDYFYFTFKSMFEQEYPIASTDGINHIFIDVKLNDYFEPMNYDIEGNYKNYHYDDGRFCIFIDKRTGYTSGWINYTGNHEELHYMAATLKNSIRPLFKDQDEFITFAEYIEPSVRLSFKENKFDENTPDETILNNVLIQHIPITVISVNPFKYELNAFYVESVRKDGTKQYDWNTEIDRIPISTYDAVVKILDPEIIYKY